MSRPQSMPPVVADRPSPLARLAATAVRRRAAVVLLWLLAIPLLIGLSGRLGGEFEADHTAYGSDSALAVEVITERFPGQGGEQIDVVVQADAGVDAVRPEVEALLRDLEASPEVLDAVGPWEGGQVSADGRTGLGALRLAATHEGEMPVEETQRLLELADAAAEPGLQIALGGQVVFIAEQGEVGSERIGLAGAAVVLLLTFGTVVAAGLPIAVALVGLAVSGALIGLLTAVLDVPEWATPLAAMLGIGIGIDYVLLMVTRFREQLTRGLSVPDAVVRTVDTAGRAVVVAGGTVVVSMLGLAMMGLSYMTGAAVAAMAAVGVVVLAALTLLPALLSLLGHRVERLRVLPLRAPSGRWHRWGRGVQRRPLLALGGGLAVLVLLTAPVADVRLGFPDAGSHPAGGSSRTAFDLTAQAFGAGAAGPLVLVSQDGTEPLTALTVALAGRDDVASVGDPVPSPDGSAALLTVVPAAAPQDPATEDLVRDLRSLAPPGVHVGGATAAAIDQTENVSDRLPLLVGGVVGLSLLLLLVVFRSPTVALKAAVLNLLSIGAAYGAVSLVLQGGAAGQLVGIDAPTPMPPFIPVLMFAVLFGLSMDYEVFLMSAVRETWTRTNDARGAVVAGLASTGRVITAAAAIMVVVFAAFVPSDDVVLKVIGVGLATAILVDATIVRMLLVPAVLHLLGERAWALPRWVDRSLPELHVEGRPEPVAAPAPLARDDLRPSRSDDARILR